MNKTTKLVTRMEVAEVRLSKTGPAVVRLEPLVPEDCENWSDVDFEEWNDENAQFGPQGDAIVVALPDDYVTPGDIVTLTIEVEEGS